MDSCSTPEKTKVVYCKDTNRKREQLDISLPLSRLYVSAAAGEVEGRTVRVIFLPAASPRALKAIRKAVRGWSLQTRSDKELDDSARMFNPYIRGWINCYSHFYQSAMYPTLRRIDVFLIRWARRKYKRPRQKPKGARDWLARVVRSTPDLFAHWKLLYGQGPNAGSRMS